MMPSVWTLWIVVCFLGLQQVGGQTRNTPPSLYIAERKWEIPVNEKVGNLVARVRAQDEDGDKITYSIAESKFQDGSHLFFINNTTGVVYLAAQLNESMVDQQFYITVKANDGSIDVSMEVWIEIVPALDNTSGSVQPASRNSKPQLPPNVQVHSGHTVVPTGKSVLPSIPTRQPVEVNFTSTAPSLPVNGTSAPPADDADTATSKMDITPIVVPLVVLIVLAPLVGWAIYLCRKRWRTRNGRSLKENFSIEFQRRSGFSESGDKLADDLATHSNTWQFDPKGIDATKWNLGQMSLASSVEGPSGSPRKDSRKWEFPRHHLRILHQLGEGCFGQVWKVEALDIAGIEGVSTLAVKTLKEAAGDKERHDLLQELEVMKLLEPHPNVVTLVGCCTEKDPIFLIMEYVSKGKLQTFLRESRTPNDYNNLHGPSALLTSRDLTTFAYQVARGMHYLTEKGIIHRDLAARNVLVSEERVCKVADFGFARDIIVSHVYERKTEGRLPIRWMAPESLYDNIFTTKSDVWSFGILLWEIVTLGSTPYPGMSAQDVMKKVREGFRLEKPEHCRRELFNLMYYCWSAEADARPGFGEIVETLEKLLLTEMDYIELDRFPEHSYYNLAAATSGERV